MVFSPPAMAAPMNPALAQAQPQSPQAQSSTLSTPNAMKQVDAAIKQQGAL